MAIIEGALGEYTVDRLGDHQASVRYHQTISAEHAPHYTQQHRKRLRLVDHGAAISEECNVWYVEM